MGQSTVTEGVLGQGGDVAQFEASGLAVGYDHTIVSGVDLRIGPGEIVALIGPNGAGKSTILKAVIGESKIFGGNIRFGAHDIGATRTAQLIRLGIGYVPQVDDAFPTLTIEENLLVGAYTLRKAQKKGRLDAVYTVFPRLHDLRQRPVYRLSGGERKMVGFGRALMSDPSLLLLDEPTANLAPVIADEILGVYLRRITDMGKMILLVEQRVAALRGLCDRVYVLGEGKVMISGQEDEVFSHPRIVEFLAGAYQLP